jgi:2-C-methyl-D-erythritol 4-phosphate cytidylyltransferase
MTEDFGVIIAAAGSGSRFGGRKQLAVLAGRPVLLYSLDLFAGVPAVAEVVVVAPAEEIELMRSIVRDWEAERLQPACGRRTCAAPRVVAGGDRRQDSVRRGLVSLGGAVGFVLVHDAARPLATESDVVRTMDAVREWGAAAIGHPVTDSVKEEREGRVIRSLDRARVWQVQTPQGASRELLERAYSSPASELHTDEVSLLEAAGVTVRLVSGSRDNIKLTHPADLDLAEFYLARQRDRGPK